MSDADTLKNAASAAPADLGDQQESADLFGGMKKKKKDKKKLDLDLELDEDNNKDSADADAEQSNAAAAEDDELNVIRRVEEEEEVQEKVALDLDAFEKEIGEADEQGDDAEPASNDAYADADDEELGDNPFARTQQTTPDAAPKDDSIEAWQGTDRDYTYQELLGRVFKTLRAQNPPSLATRKSSPWSLLRWHETFLFAELGTIGSVDGSQRLVIRGRFQPKQIENVLRRYITEYVICKTCKRPETKLTKENRIFFVTCEKCGSSVPSAPSRASNCCVSYVNHPSLSLLSTDPSPRLALDSRLSFSKLATEAMYTSQPRDIIK
ncbi:related to SUI3 - translation initiation factor eIF2 beta subunit [Ustilago trichophora]|uniref:Related to SUI3 - translation initiation factor eIF2 beta subunit n=1 Tax=Ustilago trichophora TaxID=86804 RepID=A0A5C3EAH1_9BASI|nr:related to SUI3 - translation initiation factor eIF2 beta subunit [Ustilago trichophora]